MVQAQDRNRVNAMNNEISDNLDLRAVADIFEIQEILEFERQLNDPELQISNLDLNNDNEVDYLRVIETVDNRTHVVIIQSVLDREVYQDVATIEIEKDRYNTVHLQIG
jgi:cystathionine beta-lyase family protein involved in aluminum resistance